MSQLILTPGPIFTQALMIWLDFSATSTERILQRVTREFLQQVKSDFLQQATSGASNEQILQRATSDFTTSNEQRVNFNE